MLPSVQSQSLSCLFLERKDSGAFAWLMQRLTSLCSERKRASRWEGDKERAQFTGYWSSPSDLFSILLLRLEYHPRDPLTGISDSVDTLVRAAPPTCHQSSSQHTIKMTSAAGGRCIASQRKSLLSFSDAVVHTYRERASDAESNGLKRIRRKFDVPRGLSSRALALPLNPLGLYYNWEAAAAASQAAEYRI